MGFRLVIVGGGRIGAVLARGLIESRFWGHGELLVTEVDATRRAELAATLPHVAADLSGATFADDAGAVLCVKADHAEGAARAIGAAGVPRVLSIVAGFPTARLEAALPAGTAVVRAMPNLPARVRRAVSAIAGGAHATAADLAWATSVLEALGTVRAVPELLLDAVTGLSGSMPAYLYLVVEALIEAGVRQGLTAEDARELVVGTFAGSGELLSATGLAPDALRAEVTSPGGTTAAGLGVLEHHGVRAAFVEAVAAATERSRQLGRAGDDH